MISEFTSKRHNHQYTNYRLNFHDNSFRNNTCFHIYGHFGVICCLVVPNCSMRALYFSSEEEVRLHQANVFLWVSTWHVVAIYLNCVAFVVERVIAILECWTYLENIFATLWCCMTAENWKWIFDGLKFVISHNRMADRSLGRKLNTFSIRHLFEDIRFFGNFFIHVQHVQSE